MAYELSVILRFEDARDIPTREDIERDFDCDVVEWEEEEV